MEADRCRGGKGREMPGVKDMDPVHSFRLSRFSGERFLTLSDQWWKKQTMLRNFMDWATGTINRVQLKRKDVIIIVRNCQNKTSVVFDLQDFQGQIIMRHLTLLPKYFCRNIMTEEKLMHQSMRILTRHFFVWVNFEIVNLWRNINGHIHCARC